MSIHHLECAAALELPATTKLVLLAFADSADKQTRVAFPGLANLMKWSGLKKSAALAAARVLVDRGLIARLTASRPGRRAEYLVFPNGCCAKHGALRSHTIPGQRNGSTPPDPSTPERVQTAGPEWVQPRTPTGPADDPNGSSSRRTPSLKNSAGTFTPQPPAPHAGPPTATASPAAGQLGAPPTDAPPATASPSGASRRTASPPAAPPRGTPSATAPPNGVSDCPRHADAPHPACRSCGTNTRTQRAAARRESERRPLDEIHALRASGRITPTEARSPEILELFDRVRQNLRRNRRTGIPSQGTSSALPLRGGDGLLGQERESPLPAGVAKEPRMRLDVARQILEG